MNFAQRVDVDVIAGQRPLGELATALASFVGLLPRTFVVERTRGAAGDASLHSGSHEIGLVFRPGLVMLAATHAVTVALAAADV